MTTVGRRTLGLAFYGLLLLVTTGTIGTTLYRYPLFPLQTDSLAWSNAWLAATVVDYYGAALSLCGFVWMTEGVGMRAAAWTIGICLLGSPVACLYMLQLLFLSRAIPAVGTPVTSTSDQGHQTIDSRHPYSDQQGPSHVVA